MTRVQVPDEQAPPAAQMSRQVEATQVSTARQSSGPEQEVPRVLRPSGRQSVTSALAAVSKTTQPSPAAQPLPLTGSQVRVQTLKALVPSIGIAQRPPVQSVSVRQRLRQICEPPIVAQKALRPQSPSVTQGKPMGVVPMEVVQVGAPAREMVQRWPVAHPV